MKAKELGLSGLCITDHDGIQAYETAPTLAKKQGILLGSGAEFSCIFEGLSIHVLAYDIDIQHQGLKAFCASHRARRLERNRGILERLKCLKIVIEESELYALGSMGSAVIGRPHIAQLLVQKGYVHSIRQAFQLYLGDFKSCYYQPTGFSLEETLNLIHEAGGKAFLAHPHLLPRGCNVQKLLRSDFEGIECYYARREEKRWIKIAQDKGLLISGGSDFHREEGSNSLGSSWVDEETFHKIFERF